MRQITIKASSCADCPILKFCEDEDFCYLTNNHIDIEKYTFHPDCPMVDINNTDWITDEMIKNAVTNEEARKITSHIKGKIADILKESEG